MTIKAFRQLLTALSLGGLLLAPSPVWAASRSAKRPVKSAADAGTSTAATCATGTCSPVADAAPPAEVDNKLGTAVTWMPTPDAAARAAAGEDKLVFMIQVSGNFARQEFT
ncbi:MAG TPA: hypothetical protein VG125_23155 [Pirellulales bacterium]|nr:hypothetical protein [Pirellulales bacterium]